MISAEHSLDMRLKDFFDNVYRPMRMSDSGAKAVQQYHVALNRFGAFLGHDPTLADLTEESVCRWLVAGRASKLSPVTCNGRLTKLATIWRFAKRKKYPLPPDSDLDSIDRLKVYRRNPVAWLPDEMDALLESARLARGRLSGVPADKWWLALLLVMLDTGLRRSATFEIRVAEVDFRSSLLFVPAERMKNRTEQSFRLRPGTIAAIQDSLATKREMLFPWPFIHYRALYDRYRAILRRAGLPTTKRDLFHKLRRTTASWLARAAGEGLARLQLGHRDASSIKRYLDPRFTSQHDAALLFDGPAAATQAGSNVAVGAPPAEVRAVSTPKKPKPKPSLAGPDIMEQLRVTPRLTGRDVRMALVALGIPKGQFVAELGTNGPWFLSKLDSNDAFSITMDARIRIALGLASSRPRQV